MNVRPQYLTVSQAIEGFILHKNAQGLSQRTVSSYKDILEHWAARIGGDTQVPSITSHDLKRYLVWKTTEYIPVRKNRKTHPLSPKTTRNIYVTFQAFFRWIGDEFEFPTPMKGIPVPKFVSPPIEPFTKDEVVSMVKGCVQKRESRPSNRKAFTTAASPRSERVGYGIQPLRPKADAILLDDHSHAGQAGAGAVDLYLHQPSFLKPVESGSTGTGTEPSLSGTARHYFRREASNAHIRGPAVRRISTYSENASPIRFQ